MESMAAAYGVYAALRKAVTSVIVLLALATPTRAAAPIRLLVLGDSLTAGYGLPHEDGFQAQLARALAAQGRDVKLIDAAVSGDTSAGGRARIDWALADGADAAIVELGANDMLRGLDPGQMEANLSAILDTLAAKHIPVLLTGMVALPNLGADYGNAFKAVFARLGARKGVLFDPFFLEGVAEQPKLIQADGLHREVAHLLPLVDKLLGEARG
jgi:acyl-CoA thioesterase-1